VFRFPAVALLSPVSLMRQTLLVVERFSNKLAVMFLAG